MIVAQHLLFAADWEMLIKVGVFLVFIGFSLINQVIQSIRKARKTFQPPDAAPPRPATPQPVQDEIEEFLRRAAQQKQTGQPNQPPRPQTSRQQTLRPSQMTPEVAKSLKRRAKKAGKAEVVTASVVEKPIERRHLTTVTDHLSGRSLESRVGGLQQHEQQFEVQAGLRSQHTIGTLAHDDLAATAGNEEPPGDISMAMAPATTRLAALINDPDQMRNAVILGEILARPEHRW